jgi:RecB family endonuclease NucS
LVDGILFLKECIKIGGSFRRSMQEFGEVIDDVRRAGTSVCIFASCTVNYSGRAETFLDRGERMILIKADSSVLIHQPNGTTPINYMKSGTQLTVIETEGEFILECFHKKEKAWLEITLHSILDIVSRKLDDGQKLLLEGNEKDMSDYIRMQPSLIAGNFIPISREEQTDVGFIDVFGHDGEGGLIVVECKRVTAGLQAVDQLRRYVERVKEIKGIAQVAGYLAAPAITPNAEQMLISFGFSFCCVDPPKRLDRWQKDQTSLGDF